MFYFLAGATKLQDEKILSSDSLSERESWP